MQIGTAWQQTEESSEVTHMEGSKINRFSKQRAEYFVNQNKEARETEIGLDSRSSPPIPRGKTQDAGLRHLANI